MAPAFSWIGAIVNKFSEGVSCQAERIKSRKGESNRQKRKECQVKRLE
jgi:hypothetical protein